MTQATIHEAKTHLSKLIRKALDGEEVIIANRDKPLVRLEAICAKKGRRKIGGLKHWSGQVVEGFDDLKLNREIVADFCRRSKSDPLARK